MKQVQVERFSEILIWPLELSLPKNLAGKASDNQFVNLLANEILAGSGEWERLDCYNRGTTDEPDLRYSEFVYFHSFVQKMLYPGTGDECPALRSEERRVG